MKYPRVVVDREKIRYNTLNMVEKAKREGAELVGVTKGTCAHRDVVEAMALGGIKIFADSRLENLALIQDMELPGDVELYLLRLPMVSQAKEVVERVDVSFNSQEATLEALNHEALRKGKKHQVMLMVDVGDLREGVRPSNFLSLADKTLSLKGLNLKGIATNVGCYGGVLPSIQQLETLLSLASTLEDMCGFSVEIISGGNTATTILFSQGLPQGINQLRIGEGILVGFDSTNHRVMEGFHQDAFILQAEIIEIEEKPSYPIGEIGRDAFGEIPTFQDRGIRKRAILAIGRQDVEFGSITPTMEGVEILGGSSDHLLLDISACQETLRVGDALSFILGYSGLLRVMTSGYVHK